MVFKKEKDDEKSEANVFVIDDTIDDFSLIDESEMPEDVSDLEEVG